MAEFYMARTDEDGKIVGGTSLVFPDEYTEQVTAEIWSAMDRAQLTADGWVVHEPLTVEAPAEVGTGEDFEITVTVPEGSPSEEASLMVQHGMEESELQAYDILDGVAAIPLRFDAEGNYMLLVTTRFNGSKSIGLKVIGDGEVANTAE